MTVALGQIRPVLGDVTQNVEKHLQWIGEAKIQGAELIVFPELGLTGYHVQDLTLDVARTLDAPDIQQVIAASQGIDVVFSFVEESRDHRFYVSAVYASNAQVVAVHRKVYLPTYGMFDEGRYFAAGDDFSPFATSVGSVGLLICEDAWHLSSPYLLAQGGATLLIVPASSPARSVTDQDVFGSQRFWREIASVYAQLLGVNLVFVNRVGFEDGVNFYGGSGIVSATGEWTSTAPTLTECLTLGTLDLAGVRRARYATPVVRDEKRELVARTLTDLMSRQRGGRPSEV